MKRTKSYMVKIKKKIEPEDYKITIANRSDLRNKFTITTGNDWFSNKDSPRLSYIEWIEDLMLFKKGNRDPDECKLCDTWRGAKRYKFCPDCGRKLNENI